MSVEFVVLKLDKMFGKIKHGGYRGVGEQRQDDGYKKKVGHIYYIQTEYEGRQPILLPLDMPLKMIRVGAEVNLINHKLKFGIQGKEIVKILYVEDIEVVND